MSIGRLVLTAFERPPKEGEICIYIDNDSTNEYIKNLKWGHSSGLDVDGIREIKELIADGEFEYNQIAEAYKVSCETIRNIENNVCKYYQNA